MYLLGRLGNSIRISMYLVSEDNVMAVLVKMTWREIWATWQRQWEWERAIRLGGYCAGAGNPFLTISKPQTGTKRISKCFKVSMVREATVIKGEEKKRLPAGTARFAAAVHPEHAWPWSFPSTSCKTQWCTVEEKTLAKMSSPVLFPSLGSEAMFCQFSLPRIFDQKIPNSTKFYGVFTVAKQNHWTWYDICVGSMFGHAHANGRVSSVH